LNQEIRLLAPHGTLWIYGLLGTPDTVDVAPLIRKMASIRGWLLNEIAASGSEQSAYRHVLDRVADGTYTLPVAHTFSLRDVQTAHATMERGDHLGQADFSAIDRSSLSLAAAVSPMANRLKSECHAPASRDR
jgi:NADPH2:quinone reductase